MTGWRIEVRTVVLGLLLLAGTSARGSTCEREHPAEIARTAALAFVGTVERVAEDRYRPSRLCRKATARKPQCGGKRVTFTVREELRGAPGESVNVVSQDACYYLGVYWEPGADYLVVARPDPEARKPRLLAANLCSGTGEISERQAGLEALRGPR